MSASWSPPEDTPMVSAAELRRNFGVWQERAFAAPVVVARHGKPRLVLSSAADYFASSAPEPAPVIDPVAGAILAIPEHSSEGLLVMDRTLRILAVNSVLEDMVGRSAARMVGQLWPEVFPEAAESVIAHQFRHVLHTGAAAQFETPSLLKDGRRYALTVYPHEHGIAALIVNRTSEALLREQLAEYQSLTATFGLVPHSAYVRINLRAFIESASPQFQRLLGVDPKATPLAYFPDIVVPEARAEMLEKLDRVLSGGEPVRMNVRLLARNGDLLDVGMSLAPIWNGAVAEGAMAFLRVTSV